MESFRLSKGKQKINLEDNNFHHKEEETDYPKANDCYSVDLNCGSSLFDYNIILSATVYGRLCKNIKVSCNYCKRKNKQSTLKVEIKYTINIWLYSPPSVI